LEAFIDRPSADDIFPVALGKGKKLFGSTTHPVEMSSGE